MPLTGNTHFNAANAANIKTPRYSFEFSRSNVIFTTGPILGVYAPILLASGVGGYWRLGESSGTTAVDVSGNGNNGTYIGGPTLNQPGALAHDPNSAVLFNGTSQYVSVPDAPSLRLSDSLTLSAWIYMTGAPASNAFIIDKSSGSTGYTLAVFTSGQLALTTHSTGPIAVSSGSIPFNQWVHVVATKDSIQTHLYVNGVDVTSPNITLTLTDNTSPLAIGAMSGGGSSFFPGLIDEVAVIADAIGPNTVTNLYNTGIGKLSGTPFPFYSYADLPIGGACQVLPETGESTIGQMSAKLHDIGGIVTRYVTEGICGDTVTVKMGFAELGYSDYVTRFTGTVDSVTSADGLLAYQIVLQAVAALQDREIFDVSASTLIADITSGATSLIVAEGTFFLPSGYIIIDSEIIQYSGHALRGDGNWDITGLIRGVLGTTAAAHLTGASVREMIRLGPAHPLDIAQTVMQATDKTGMGMSLAQIDTVDYATAKTEVGDFQMEFRITSKANGIQWLEQQIFRPCASYAFENADGTQSIKVFRQPTLASLAGTIDESVMADDYDIQWSTQRTNKLINKITFQWDYDAPSEKFLSSITLTNDASIAKYGAYEGATVQSYGLRSELPLTSDFISARGGAILARGGDPPVYITPKTKLALHRFETGDIVGFTHRLMPNPITGTRGVDNLLMEIVGQTIDFQSGDVTFELQSTGFFGFAAVWAPPATNDYASATELDKQQFAWWADGSGENLGAPAKLWSY